MKKNKKNMCILKKMCYNAFYMKEVSVILKINDFILEKKGILKNNIVTFKDKDIVYTFDIDNLILIRDSLDYMITIDFYKEKSYCYYDKVNQTKFLLNLDIIELQNKKNVFIISYRIEEESFCFSLNYI